MPILELFDSHAFRGLKSTTLTELRYFHLHGNPLKSSSTNFHPESLFVFDMPHSNLEQLWNADQVHNFQRLENRPQKALYLGQRKRKLNPTIELFSKLLDRFVKQKIAIEVDHGDDMYGDQSVTFITSEDCNIMFSMTELTVSCIDFYIRMLYKQLKDDDMLGQFAFINPSSVSPAGGLKYVRRGEGGRVIASCLQRATPTQLIFMPYNPRGSMDAFLMNIMQIGLTNYHSHNGNQSDKGFVQWECVQVPMQSGNFECGYYVLRFMKDIIADRSVLTENFHGKRTYTQEEIDEVRDEWTTCFLEYL
ncbi:hypothetical protein Ddye_003876 [Dipteronia dyeriana]|uniref:Ubiquitin-like protease family profile domain-containing protein n=1 Tax=Dipteronia dyeriana TaxID=168575 RepID=A0AAD9XTM9_9ROSI|nr:hypothetical protein Ddye_003876 [Dipteronia dyeriana]